MACRRANESTKWLLVTVVYCCSSVKAFKEPQSPENLSHSRWIISLTTDYLNFPSYYTSYGFPSIVTVMLTLQCLVSTNRSEILKGTLSGLRQFLATEIPLKLMKNTFYFTSEALFVLNIFNFLSWLFWSCNKTAWLRKKVNFKFMTS